MNRPHGAYTRSMSQLGQFAQCGLSFQLVRLHKIPEVPATPLLMGIAVHHGIAEWLLRGDEAAAVAAAEDRFAALVARDLQQFPDTEEWVRTPGRSTPEDLAEREAAIPVHVAGYIARARTEDLRPWHTPDGRPAVELRFRTEFGGVPVTGAVDMVLEGPSGELLVQDVKSGAEASPSPLQLAVYRYGLLDAHGVDVGRGRWWLTGGEGPGEPIDLTAYSREWVADQFAMLDRAIEAGVFVANPGPWCRTCRVRQSCPAIHGDAHPQRRPSRNGGGDREWVKSGWGMTKKDLPAPHPDADPQGPFFGRHVCISGEQRLDKAEALHMVAELGGIPELGVTKRLQVLVYGSPGTSKYRKAQEYIARGQQIELLTEEEFLRATGRA